MTLNVTSTYGIASGGLHAGDWLVHEGYRVVGHKSIVPAGGFARRYDALAIRCQEVVPHLVRLRGAPEREFARFAQRWGLLGLAEAEERETWEGINIVFHVAGRGYGRDDVETVRAHARQVGAVLDLQYALEAGDEQGHREALEACRRLSPGTADSGLAGRFYVEPTSRPERGPEGIAVDSLEHAERVIIAAIINANLEHVYYQLNRALRLGPVCPDLITAVYWHLARIVEAGRLSRCAECGELFLQRDARQRYCPPEAWQAGRAESRCAVRARQRQYRAKPKKEGEGEPEAGSVEGRSEEEPNGG